MDSIADLVSQSSSQSANNPFAKGASPFSSNKKINSNSVDSNISRNSPNPATPARGKLYQNQIPDRVQVPSDMGLDNIVTKNLLAFDLLLWAMIK